MRVYQLRHYEVMMPEENSKEAQHLLYYERLCYDLLTAHAISFSHAVEVMKLKTARCLCFQNSLYAYRLP